MATSKFASYFGGIGRALSARDYRIYWYCHMFSSHGVWMHRMGVGVLIFQLTGSPAWLGFVGFVYLLPLVVLGPIAGAMADRFGVRRTAIVAILMTVGVTFLMGSLTLAQVMTPPILAALVIILGVVHAFDFPVRMVLIQLLVGRERMSAAIALNSTTFNTSAFTGPMIGAGILALGQRYIGDSAPGILFFVYGLSMAALLSAVLRTNMRDAQSPGGNFADLRRDIADGVRYTLGHDSLRTCLALWCCIAMLIRAYLDLLPGYALAIFPHGTDGVGTMMSASGIGALCFSLFMALRGRTEGLTRILILACGTSSSALFLFSLTANFWLAAAVMTVVGGTLVVAAISSQSLVQNSSDPRFRTRVVGVYFALISGAQASGALVIGWIAEFAGFQVAFGIAGAVGFTVVLLMARRLTRRAPLLEAQQADPPPATAPAAAVKQA